MFVVELVENVSLVTRVASDQTYVCDEKLDPVVDYDYMKSLRRIMSAEINDQGSHFNHKMSRGKDKLIIGGV